MPKDKQSHDTNDQFIHLTVEKWKDPAFLLAIKNFWKSNFSRFTLSSEITYIFWFISEPPQLPNEMTVYLEIQGDNLTPHLITGQPPLKNNPKSIILHGTPSQLSTTKSLDSVEIIPNLPPNLQKDKLGYISYILLLAGYTASRFAQGYERDSNAEKFVQVQETSSFFRDEHVMPRAPSKPAQPIQPKVTVPAAFPSPLEKPPLHVEATPFPKAKIIEKTVVTEKLKKTENTPPKLETNPFYNTKTDEPEVYDSAVKSALTKSDEEFTTVEKPAASSNIPEMLSENQIATEEPEKELLDPKKGGYVTVSPKQLQQFIKVMEITSKIQILPTKEPQPNAITVRNGSLSGNNLKRTIPIAGLRQNFIPHSRYSTPTNIIEAAPEEISFKLDIPNIQAGFIMGNKLPNPKTIEEWKRSHAKIYMILPGPATFIDYLREYIKVLQLEPDFPNDTKMKDIFTLTKSMIVLLYYEVRVKHPEFAVSRAITELNSHGFIDPTLKAPHLTKKGLIMRELLLIGTILNMDYFFTLPLGSMGSVIDKLGDFDANTIRHTGTPPKRIVVDDLNKLSQYQNANRYYTSNSTYASNRPTPNQAYQPNNYNRSGRYDGSGCAARCICLILFLIVAGIASLFQ